MQNSNVALQLLLLPELASAERAAEAPGGLGRQTLLLDAGDRARHGAMRQALGHPAGGERELERGLCLGILRQRVLLELGDEGSLLMAHVAASHLPVPQYRPLLKLMKQPILLPDASAAFSQNALLMGAQVDLEVALLRGPMVTVRTLEGLLPGVCAHMEGQDAVEAEALPTQRARILPVLAVVFLARARLRDNALVGDAHELRKLHSSIHAAQNSGIHYLIGQKCHLARNWVGCQVNEALLLGIR